MAVAVLSFGQNQQNWQEEELTPFCRLAPHPRARQQLLDWLVQCAILRGNREYLMGRTRRHHSGIWEPRDPAPADAGTEVRAGRG